MFSREDDTGYIAVRNALAEELGLHPSVLEAEREAKRTSIADLTVNADGSYTVLGIDRFDDEFWVERKYTGRNARNRALAQARTLTAEARIGSMKYSNIWYCHS